MPPTHPASTLQVPAPPAVYADRLASEACNLSPVEGRHRLDGALAARLRSVVGPEALIDQPERLRVYEQDAFTLLRALPCAVVFPADTAEASAVMAMLHEAGVPVVPRGAGTSLSGGTVAHHEAVLVSTARMKRVLEVDRLGRVAHVQAGLANAELGRHVAPLGLTYAPDPSSANSATIGGNIATNAGGPHTLKAGVTSRYLLGVRAVLADGRVVQAGGPLAEMPDSPLLAGFCGTEGLCGLVCEAWVRLSRRQNAARTTLAVFDAVEQAARCVGELLASGVMPVAIEMMDHHMIGVVEAASPTGLPADAAAVLIIEIEGVEAELDEQQSVVSSICRACRAREPLGVAADPQRRAELWKARKRAFGAIGRLSPTYCTQDGVVPPSALPHMMQAIGQIGRRYGLSIGNVFHAGDGNIHPILLYREQDADQVRRVIAASEEILAECVRVGGSITGEHGIGLEKRAQLRLMFSEADLLPMRAVRDCFDPEHRLNRSKVFAEPGEDESLTSLVRPMRCAPQ